ncbi:transcriptional regulator NrdR [Ructibacterium gallinarum]|uniref:Transcriptional repressor NrdR n=1 Tax=Ructibacterium gallinarum TaxID=2779355 RepID=A0A9D5M261_9FIRM|nr:transcriptional regulator NrdR [Ructibacterium gallinarum]MBE5040920.1 transcriptional repressor NrdR [Ructibacterium gallinarum]
MRCYYCGHLESKVVDSRSTEDGTAIRRRRECLNCGKRFTTYEKIESAPIIVIKKDGSRQSFDREKLQRGILNSCASRPVSLHAIDSMLDEIEGEIHNSLAREVSSQKIGEMVMERLRKIDEVAYVRFASVYKQFKDIETFKEELAKLTSQKEQDDK